MKNRMRNLLDKTLFNEAFRQTKWIASAFVVLCGIALVFSKVTGNEITSDKICYVFFIFAALSVFRLFGFLNRRAGSDFYHMLSIKRSTVYLSYSSVVFIWIAVLMLIFYLFNYRIAWETNHNIDFITYMAEYVFYLAGTVLVAGAALLAVSVTGNTMTGIVVMLSVLFVPRLLINNYVEAFYSLCPYLSQSDLFGKIISPDYHILYDIIDNAFNNSYVDVVSPEYLEYFISDAYTYKMTQAVTINVISIVYSFVLGIAYAVAGGVLYKKRMSEAAGNGALNSFIQCVLRISIAMVICISPITMLAKFFLNQTNEFSIIAIVVRFLIAICVWLLIEGITTRSHKKIIKSLRQLPILVMLNIALLTLFVFCGDVTSKNVPSAENVESVKIVSDLFVNRSDVEITTDEEYSQFQEVPAAFFEKISFTEDTDIEIFVNELAQEMSIYRKNQSAYNNIKGLEKYYPVEVVFETERQSIRRKMYLSLKDAESIYYSAYNMASDIYEYENLLSENNRKHTFESGSKISVYGYGLNLNARDRIELYSVLFDEIQERSLPLSTYMGYLYDREDALAYIVKEEDIGKLYIPVSLETPKTLQTLIDITNQEFDTSYFETDYVDEAKGSRGIQLVLFSKEVQKIEQAEYVWEGMIETKKYDAELEKLRQIYTSRKDEPVNADDNILGVVYLLSGNYRGCTWCNVTDEEVNEILKFKALQEESDR